MRLALLGDPVDHSRSPAIHTAALRAAGIDASYEARAVDEDGLAAAVAQIRDGALDGANVTMPHKHLAARLCDDLVPPADRMSAVNTMVRSGGRVLGHNTDVAGIVAAWRDRGLPADGPVLVLGAGGAAAAAVIALEGRDTTVMSRRPDRAARLLERLAAPGTVIAWSRSFPGASVVNATPIGMHGEPLPGAVLAGAIGLLDMAYGPAPTPAVEAARRAGLPVADGLDMLIGQAMASFTLWTGVGADRVAMERAARPS